MSVDDQKRHITTCKTNRYSEKNNLQKIISDLSNEILILKKEVDMLRRDKEDLQELYRDKVVCNGCKKACK